jgi:RNA polymerase sigma-B factor
MDPVPSTELFARWRERGDLQARTELVERSLPLARKLAGRYLRGASEPFDDLMQVANLGLVKAVDRFDPDRGTSFSSFAVPTILGELKRYFRDTGWSAHVPRGAQELALRVQDAEHAVSERTGRSATIQQVAEYLGVSVEEVTDGLQAAAAHHASSLDAPHDEIDEHSRTLVETLGDDDEHYARIDERETIATAARELPGREQQVLALRFREELTQTQIAERIGVSQMQVSRILRRTLEQVRVLTAETDQTLPLETQRRDEPIGQALLDARNPQVNCAPPPTPAGLLPPPLRGPSRSEEPPHITASNESRARITTRGDERGPIGGRSGGKVRLLEADPDLGEELPPRDREQAQLALIVSTLHAPVGGWHPTVLARGSTGLLVLKGFLVRRLRVGQGAACELLGPGDLLRPSDDPLPEHFLPATPCWQVLQDVSLAVLDQRTAVLMNQWPALTDEILARVLRRAQALTYLLAIHRFSRIDDRLLRTLWHLASLWGRVRPGGIVIPVPLSHETLGQIVAAARPSVTTSVSSLEERQLVTRDDAGYFVLHGAPPTTGREA